jgi:hypothetical protein
LSEELPIRQLWKYREQLSDAVDACEWGEAERFAKMIVRGIRLALDPATCGTGKPTLDGLYSIGTQRYSRAPDKTKRALNHMNRILKTAKKSIPGKGK